MKRVAPRSPVRLRSVARTNAVVAVTVGLLATFGTGSTLGCSGRGPPPTSEPPPQAITIIEAAPPPAPDDAPRSLPKKDEKRRGIGWYPNVEVTRDNRLALAWVDADRGDVRYAVTAPGGNALDGDVVAVDTDGAVGGFLRLALGPGDAPVFAYVRQDRSLLRVTWRPADRARMKEAGADVDLAPLPPLGVADNTGAPVAVGAGFVAEEVGFGEQVGRGASLVVDRGGRFALAYYAADDRLRVARRPVDLPAQGPASTGVLEKRDVDGARGSIRVLTDTAVLDDGTLVVSYADDVVTDARLRVAVLAPGAPRFVVARVDDGPAITLDGLASSLHPRPVVTGSPRIVDVVALDKSERGVFVRAFDVDRAVFVGERERLVDVEGVAVADRSPAGWFVLARVRGAGGGVFLYVVDEKRDEAGRVTRDVRRIRLGGGGDQDDAWIDIVTRPDGRPAAVWFDADAAALRLYAP